MAAIYEEELVDKALKQQTTVYPVDVFISLAISKSIGLATGFLGDVVNIISPLMSASRLGLETLYLTSGVFFDASSLWTEGYDHTRTSALAVYFTRCKTDANNVCSNDSGKELYWQQHGENALRLFYSVLPDDKEELALDREEQYFAGLWDNYHEDIQAGGGLTLSRKQEDREVVKDIILAALQENKHILPNRVTNQAESPITMEALNPDGSVVSENVFYDKERERLVLLGDDAQISSLRVTGTESGTYNFSIFNQDDGAIVRLRAENIPVTIGSVHSYHLDWNKLADSQPGAVVLVDADGDGHYESKVVSDNTLTQEDYILQTQTAVDVDPDTLNLESKGKVITTYIELPEGYDVASIDVASVMLNETITAETKPTEIGDDDKDGIPDLMVKFDRAAVQNGLLESDGEATIEISGYLQAEDGEKIFRGRDSIRVKP